MSDIKIFHDNDADLSLLNGLTVGVIGYGSQGRAQALNMRDSGVKVIVGVRQGPSFEKAKEDGFTVLSVKEAAEQAGFNVAFTTVNKKVKPGMNKFELPRVRMYSEITFNGFKDSI